MYSGDLPFGEWEIILRRILKMMQSRTGSLCNACLGSERHVCRKNMFKYGYHVLLTTYSDIAMTLWLNIFNMTHSDLGS